MNWEEQIEMMQKLGIDLVPGKSSFAEVITELAKIIVGLKMRVEKLEERNEGKTDNT